MEADDATRLCSYLVLLGCVFTGVSSAFLTEVIFRKSKETIDFWFLFLSQNLTVICFGVCILTPAKNQVNAHCMGGEKLNPLNSANLWGSRWKRIVMLWLLFLSLVSPQFPVPPSPSALFFLNYLQRLATIAQRFCLFNVLLPPRTETVTLPIASLSLPFAFSSCLLTVAFQTPWYSGLRGDKGWGLLLRLRCWQAQMRADTPWQPGPNAVRPSPGVPASASWQSHLPQILPMKHLGACASVGLHRGYGLLL